MEQDQNLARIVPAEWAKPAPLDAVVIGGKTIEVSQNHLLEPFVGLLGTMERLASVAGQGGQGGADEETCVRAVFCSLYSFFQTLLPSASGEAIDGLTYAVSLLLVGEAIEANRNVRVVLHPPSFPTGGSSQ